MKGKHENKKLFSLLLCIVLLFCSDTSVFAIGTLTGVTNINFSGYPRVGGIAIKTSNSKLFVLKANNDDSAVALYKGVINSSATGMESTPLNCVKVFSSSALGHANDCTFYNNNLYVAPKGDDTRYGYVNGKSYKVVGVNLLGSGYELRGYTLKNNFMDYVAGICYLNKSHDGYPMFALKCSSTVCTAYLKETTFVKINSFTIKHSDPAGASGNVKLVSQGVSFDGTYLYFGFGIRENGSDKCGNRAYITRIALSNLKTSGSKYQTSVYLNKVCSTFSKFEVEGIDFIDGHIWFSANGIKNSVAHDVLYQATK